VGAAQRLNVTMMGMPAVTPGSFPPPPESRPAPTGTGSRVPLLVAGGVVLAILAYFFLFQGERRPMRFTCAGNTDKGSVRTGNEDIFLVDHQHGVFIVADGMGGHAAGEVASDMAVGMIAKEINGIRSLGDREASARMGEAIRDANAAIFDRTLAEHDKRGMGTTVTVMVLFATRYLIGQVGDSRAYLLREGALTQITKDHSYVQEQVDAGLLTPEQARTHPYSNVITRCVGANEEVVPDIYYGRIRKGDIILLASDGLTGMLEDEQLAAILKTEGGPDTWVDRMIADANRRGGLDNITVIVVRIDEVDPNTGEHRITAATAGSA
jgi:protein phosphatase